MSDRQEQLTERGRENPAADDGNRASLSVLDRLEVVEDLLGQGKRATPPGLVPVPCHAWSVGAYVVDRAGQPGEAHSSWRRDEGRTSGLTP